MDKLIIRSATRNDIPFLVDTIIEAEKAGTNVLSWSTIFGLSEGEVRKYLAEMLAEEIDGCELSVSSFMVAETGGKVVAALSAWIEGKSGESSAQLKGNLLSYFLPKKCIIRASKILPVVQELNIDYTPGSIQKGAGYILRDFRNQNLFQILTNQIIERLAGNNPDVSKAYTQIYGCNIPAIRANEKLGFMITVEKESSNIEILKYLPSNKKVVMEKNIYT